MIDFLSSPLNQWIWDAAQTVSIIVGFVFVYRQIRLAGYQNSITHLNYFRDLWKSEQLMRARGTLWDRPIDREIDFLGHEDVLATFMNDLGLAVATNQADRQHVYSYFGYYVEGHWLVLGPKILRYRERMSDPNFFANFEKLYRTVQEINTKSSSLPMRPGHAADFLIQEKVLADFMLGRDGA